jgi:hypothetical protein
MAGASSIFSQEYNNTSNDLPGLTKAFAYAFVADNATAAFTAHTTAYSFDGALAAVGVKFGTTAPNSLTVTIADVLGVTIATGTVTASGYLELDRPLFFTPGPLTITLSGNTTNSAAATVALTFA